MAHVYNEPLAALDRTFRGALSVQFARFAGAALAALTATEIVLTVANGVFHLTSTPAALVSWFAGAVVSYALSRWAWRRTGRPDVLRETIPFWAISAAVIVVLTLANKVGYRSAAWLHLTGAGHVLWVDFIWLLANFGTFLLRFAVFHYVLFSERPAAHRRPAAPSAATPGAHASRHPASRHPASRHPAPRHPAPRHPAPRHAAAPQARPVPHPAPRHAAAPGAHAA